MILFHRSIDQFLAPSSSVISIIDNENGCELAPGGYMSMVATGLYLTCFIMVLCLLTGTVRNHDHDLPAYVERWPGEHNEPRTSHAGKRMIWTKQDDQDLRAYVERWPGQHTEPLWRSVAQDVFPETDRNPGRTSHACKARFRLLEQKLLSDQQQNA